jgi:ribosome-associated translation inhibitor RaiA
MADYYTIHFYAQFYEQGSGEDRLKNYALYPTFEKAAKALDEVIKREIERYNARYDEKLEFEQLTTEELREDEEHMKNRRYLHYYEAENGYLFVICKMTVVEEKKKYVYQYWVQNKICGLHTKSDKYASFDEVCDALDMELRQLYEVYGGEKPFEPLQSREEVKTLLETCPTVVYAYVNDGSGSMTDKYVLSRQDA